QNSTNKNHQCITTSLMFMDMVLYPESCDGTSFIMILLIQIGTCIYQGKDQIHITSGQGMNISYIGHTSLTAPGRCFTLKDVLHGDAQEGYIHFKFLAITICYFMHTDVWGQTFIDEYNKLTWTLIGEANTKSLIHSLQSDCKLDETIEYNNDLEDLQYSL
ncbi:hypothetical protein ACJX0J_015657, partial [Zea mays]